MRVATIGAPGAIEKIRRIVYPAEVEQITDSIVVLSIDESYAGYITIADEIKEDVIGLVVIYSSFTGVKHFFCYPHKLLLKLPLQITQDRGGKGYGRTSLTKWAIENYEPQDDRGSHFAIRKFFILKDEEQNAPYPADRLPPGYNYGDTIWLDWSDDITTEHNSRVDWPFSRKADAADLNNVGGSSAFNDQIYLRLAETYLLKAESTISAYQC